MYLKYMDGSSGDDVIFDLALRDRRSIVARDMNLHPEQPETWPTETIDQLLGIRQFEGERRYHTELSKMLMPPPFARR